MKANENVLCLNKDILDLEGEIWKDIEGYEGSYQISNMGRVKSFNNRKPRILKSTENGCGYLSLDLSKNNVAKHCTIHRLVAKTFLSNPNNLPCVNHKNGIKTDNRVENLEWCTYQENSLHSIHKLNNGNHKVSLQTAEEIRNDYENGKSIKEIIDEYDVTYAVVVGIIRNRYYLKESNGKIVHKHITTREIADSIRIKYDSTNVSMTDLSKEYNLNPSVVEDIINNRTFVDENYVVKKHLKKIDTYKTGDVYNNFKILGKVLIKSKYKNSQTRLKVQCLSCGKISTRYPSEMSIKCKCQTIKYDGNDFIGRKIGQWTIIEYLGRDEHSRMKVKCKNKYYEEKILDLHNLMRNLK